MRLPTQKRILREDLKDSPNWIIPLINVVNSFMETVYQAMNHNITFSENVNCMIKSLTYVTPSGYPSGVDNMQFISTLKSKATSVILMQVYDNADYTPPPGPVYVPWVENNGNIIIYPITGLEASKTYLINLLIS